MAYVWPLLIHAVHVPEPFSLLEAQVNFQKMPQNVFQLTAGKRCLFWQS